MMMFRYIIFVEDQDVVKFVGKVLVEGLLQKELNVVYDDVCKDYDKVLIFYLYIFLMMI